jgi:hypothetical protein
VKARSDKDEALLEAMNGVLADLTPRQLSSEFCRMLAYSSLPKNLVKEIRNNGDYDNEAVRRQYDKRDAYKKRRGEANCAMRKAP